MLLICRNNPNSHAMLRQVVQENGESRPIINKFFKKIFIVNCSGNSKLVLCDDPFAMLYAIFFYNKKNTHLRLWVLEIWQYQVHLKGIKAWLRYFAFTTASYLCFKISDSILFSSRTRRDFICTKYSRLGLASKSRIVLNIPEFFQARPFNDDQLIQKFSKFKSTYKKLLIYAGSLQEGRLISNLIRAKHRFQNIGLIICGDGPLESYISSSQKTDRSILFLGNLNRSTLSYVYGECDFGVLSYDNELLNTRLCAPLKIWEYLHHDLIILGNNNLALMGEWSEYIDCFYENESDIFAIIEEGVEKKLKKRIPVFDREKVIGM
jgi:glycosyltransferase involved in cell wall biosynthesis